MFGLAATLTQGSTVISAKATITVILSNSAPVQTYYYTEALSDKLNIKVKGLIWISLLEFIY
jgi:hypothetical protein